MREPKKKVDFLNVNNKIHPEVGVIGWEVLWANDVKYFERMRTNSWGRGSQNVVENKKHKRVVQVIKMISKKMEQTRQKGEILSNRYT